MYPKNKTMSAPIEEIRTLRLSAVGQVEEKGTDGADSGEFGTIYV